jgi:hypothetical protein
MLPLPKMERKLLIPRAGQNPFFIVRCEPPLFPLPGQNRYLQDYQRDDQHPQQTHLLSKPRLLLW